MHLLLVGVSHKTAPIELRERLDFVSRGAERALVSLATLPPLGEAAIVSTCNRSELYAASAALEPGLARLRHFLAEFHGITEQDIRPHVYEAVDGEAARHLFRVAAGLDSLVVGEPQILGQVKEAYARAASLHCAGPLLSRVFHASFGAGKRVRSETGLGEGTVSVSYAAVELARKIFGDLCRRRVLILGAGEMAKLAARNLKAHGVRSFAIASRSSANLEAMLQAIEADRVEWEHRFAAMVDVDIVISATGSPRPVLTRADVEPILPGRRGRPLFIIDIALPRDVEPGLGETEEIFLYNLDDLQAVVRENMARRQSQLDQADAIINEEAERFGSWLRSRAAIPTVIALRQRFELIRQAELKRLEPKLATLGPDARRRIDEITRLLIEKLLLGPTEQLKMISTPETMLASVDVLTRLFDLRAETALSIAGASERPTDEQVADRGALQPAQRK